MNEVLKEIACGYCQKPIGTGWKTDGDRFAVCASESCRERFADEWRECYREASGSNKPENKPGALKLPAGYLERTISVGEIRVRVYRNESSAGQSFKCRMLRVLPEHYKKEYSDTLPESHLTDAMRALYRAQRFIASRRRELGLKDPAWWLKFFWP